MIEEQEKQAAAQASEKAKASALAKAQKKLAEDQANLQALQSNQPVQIN
ncbi:hypothetical protein [Oenococcus oeni]|nr:hypothetical protein [Oenococcus oeni]